MASSVLAAANKLQKAIDKLRKETNRLMRLQTSLKSTKEALASLTERLNVLQMEMNDDENIEQLPESARTVGNNVADVQQGNRDNGCLCLFCGQVIKRTYHLLHFHAHILSHFKDVADVQQVNPDKDRLCLFCGQIIKRPHRLVDFHVHVLSHFKDEDVKCHTRGRDNLRIQSHRTMGCEQLTSQAGVKVINRIPECIKQLGASFLLDPTFVKRLRGGAGAVRVLKGTQTSVLAVVTFCLVFSLTLCRKQPTLLKTDCTVARTHHTGYRLVADVCPDTTPLHCAAASLDTDAITAYNTVQI
ncbi:hypothetical protein J6590_074186 [Homalodisca vitripennis]|nr:hypothetical protein J6590_074186 [Homalodisca vitripennis]